MELGTTKNLDDFSQDRFIIIQYVSEDKFEMLKKNHTPEVPSYKNSTDGEIPSNVNLNMVFIYGICVKYFFI